MDPSGRTIHGPTPPADTAGSTNQGERVTAAFDGNLHTLAASGDGDPELLLDRPGRQWALDWSTDGHTLLFGESHPQTNTDIWVYSLADGHAEPLVAGEANENSARLSSDGPLNPNDPGHRVARTPTVAQGKRLLTYRAPHTS